MRFLVTYIDHLGNQQQQIVNADSPELAVESLGSELDVIDVSEKGKGDIELFARKKVSLKDQGVILTALASGEESGQDSLSLLATFLDKRGYSYDPGSESDTLAKQLRDLGFSELAVLVVESGMSSGNLAQSLGQASQEVNRLLSQKSVLASKSKTGTFYLLIGLVILFLAPLMSKSVVGPLIESGLINKTPMIDAIFSLNVVNMTFLIWAIPLSAVVGFIYRYPIFSALKSIPVLSAPYQWFITRRSIQFNMALDILTSAGYSTLVVPQKMLSASGKYDKEIYNNMISEIELGAKLSSTITEEHWPDIYVLALNNFEATIPESRQKIIRNASTMLIQEDEAISSVIATLLSLAGIIFVGLGILVLVQGVMLPLLSMDL